MSIETSKHAICVQFLFLLYTGSLAYANFTNFTTGSILQGRFEINHKSRN